MASIQGTSVIGGADLYTSNTQPSGAYIGQYSAGSNGTGFRYAKAGASNLVVGNMIQSAAIDTQFNDLAVTAGAAPQNVINLTNGTTTVSAGDLVGYSATVSVTPGLGQTFTITGNTAGTNGGAFSITVDRNVRVALTTSSKVTIRQNPWNAVIQSPATTLTGVPAGACIFIINAGEYGWLQTHGIGGALSDNTSIIAGSQVSVPSGTAGAVTLFTGALPAVGYAQQAASSGKVIPVFFQID